ncbi:hypothetical protein NHF46_09385 [Arthrobacter alpinus]|nr:hypothetical protein [Arthrobacter alpinus]
MDGRAARTASLLLWACFALVVGFLGLRRLWQALSFPCSQLCAAPSLDAGAAATLQSHGISLAQYAWASVLAIGLLMAGSLVLAAAVARFGRSSAGAAAVLVAVAASMANPPGPGGTGIAGRICTTAAQLGILWLFAAFPRTRLRPDWLWLPVACGSVWAVGSLWIPALRSAIDAEQFPWVPLEGLIFVAAFATIAVGRIRAYPKESPTVRRQLRLVLAALVLLCLVGVAGSLSTAGLDGAGAGSLAGAAWFHVGSGALVLVVAAMGAAFTSHNAWGPHFAQRRHGPIRPDGPARPGGCGPGHGTHGTFGRPALLAGGHIYDGGGPPCAASGHPASVVPQPSRRPHRKPGQCPGNGPGRGRRTV